jgi:hypothetical protein
MLNLKLYRKMNTDQITFYVGLVQFLFLDEDYLKFIQYFLKFIFIEIK